MDLNRKILILLIIFILCYILFRIVIKRIQIKQYMEGYENQDVNTSKNKKKVFINILLNDYNTNIQKLLRTKKLFYYIYNI